ncbi:MAG: leucine-rich repeat domain-containing protein [Oscillospiraceae bacterium]|nr:leucine-rich repeat domain-containing protein [Oscillospiraceae bacterium]
MGLFGKKPSADKIKYRRPDRVERGEFRKQEIAELSMPDTVRIIGESGFRECRSLKRAELSNTLCEIGAYAFRDCDMLENIVMPGEMRYPDGSSGLLGIGCFEGCGLLREIVIPEGVSVIGANAFHNCAALETVTLPRSLHAIRSGAFSGCARLKTLNMPVVPELIAQDAFRDTPCEKQIAAVRKPVLTIMHTSSFGLPEIFQFSAVPRMIGTEQTEGNMTIVLDDVDASRICFRITAYKHAGGSHVVPAGTAARLFYEEYDCAGKTGMQKEELVASYR